MKKIIALVICVFCCSLVFSINTNGLKKAVIKASESAGKTAEMNSRRIEKISKEMSEKVQRRAKLESAPSSKTTKRLGKIKERTKLCPLCHGSGKDYSGKQCPLCYGIGVVPIQKYIKFEDDKKSQLTKTSYGVSSESNKKSKKKGKITIWAACLVIISGYLLYRKYMNETKMK